MRAAQDRMAAQMVRARRGTGALLAFDEGVARDPLGAWHLLGQPGGLSRMVP